MYRSPRQRFPLVSISSIIIAAASSSGCGEGSDATSSSELLSRCAGSYRCVGVDGDVFEADLGLQDGSCWAGGVALLADGRLATARGIDPDAFWTGDATHFEICIGNDCIRCDGEGQPQQAQQDDSGGQCAGWADSCSSQSEGDCSRQRGCYVGYTVKWDGSTKPVCKGVATHCSDLDEASTCNRQGGCRWVR